MKVAEIMTKDPIVVRPNDQLQLAYDLMRGRHVRHIPVIKDGDLCGVISERDIRYSAIAYDDDDDKEKKIFLAGHSTVEDLMARDPICATEEEQLSDALRKVIDHKLGCLPVVSGKELVGIVTVEDFMRLLLDMLENKK